MTTDAPTNTNTLLQYAALFASEWGFAVFPLHGIDPAGDCTCGFSDCKSPGKHPLSELAPNGVKNATKDVEQIRLWWTLKPFANIGVACGKDSGLAVVDVDEAKGGEVSALGEMPDTVAVKTGGGMHFYFRCPESEIRNSASVLAPFVDVRGEGGYVVAPPSRHANGSEYAFLTDSGSLSPFPAEWVERLAAPSVRQHSTPNGNGNGNGHGSYTPGHTLVVPPPSGLTVPEAIAAGSRNETLIKLAGGIRRYGVSENGIFSLLRIENQRLCKPPLEDSELHKIAYSAARYDPAEDLSQVGPDVPEDERPITTTHFRYAGEFRKQVLPDRDVIAFHLAKQEWAVLAAIKNAGKSTFLRNASICMAAGKALEPFYSGGVPRKVLYLDFETTNEMLMSDINTMFGGLTREEQETADANLIFAHKGIINGELFSFQRHMAAIEAIVKQEGVELVIVDNMSAAFQVLDEQANAIINSKVVQPILRFTAMADCALILVHHSGKSNDNSHYASRGASVLEDLAPVGFKVSGDMHNDGPMDVENIKRKDGPGYSVSFKLNRDTRWLEPTLSVMPKGKKTAYHAIKDFVQSKTYPFTVSTKEIMQKFEMDYPVSTIKLALKDLVDHERIAKPKHGFYCAAIDEKGQEMEGDDW